MVHDSSLWPAASGLALGFLETVHRFLKPQILVNFVVWMKYFLFFFDNEEASKYFYQWELEHLLSNFVRINTF